MSPSRNSTYYTNDCNLVLQVENELFKIDISRLAIHSEVFGNMLKLPSDTDSTEGGSDANPVVLPQIKTEEFVNLLYVFYQSPIDPEHILFMAGALNQANQNLKSFKRYLDISRLAHRFCMPELEAWAKSQLVVLEVSGSTLKWIDLKNSLALLSYAKLSTDSEDNEFVQITTNTVYYVLSRVDKARVLELYQDNVADNLGGPLRAAILIRMLRLGQKYWATKLS